MESFPDLATLQLSIGVHPDREAGVCLLEAVAWWAGEPHTSRPDCVCPVLASLCAELNDCMTDEERSLLVYLIPALAGSRAGAEIEWQRAFLLADYALREGRAQVLEGWGFVEQALQLLECTPIADFSSAAAVASVLEQQAPHYPPKHRYWFGDHPGWVAQGISNATNPVSLAEGVAEMLATEGYPRTEVVSLIERACAMGQPRKFEN